MTHIRSAALMSVFGVIATPALSDSCSSILAVAYDQTSTASDKTSFTSLKTLACSNKKVLNNASGGLKYEDISGTFSSSNEEVDAWCNGSNSFSFLDQKFRQNIQTVNPLVVSAWSDCMNALGAKLGVKAALDPDTLSPIILIFGLAYNAATPGDKGIVKNTQLKNLTCNGLPNRNDQINVRQNYTCTRTNQYKPATLSVSFTNIPSPDPIIVPGLPTPFSAKYELSGAYRRQDGTVGVTVVQSGPNIAWTAESADWSMTMQGGYYTDIMATGVQTRTHKSGDFCTNQMTVVITALDNHHWSHTSNYRSGPPCGGVGPGFTEGPFVFSIP